MKFISYRNHRLTNLTSLFLVFAIALAAIGCGGESKESDPSSEKDKAEAQDPPKVVSSTVEKITAKQLDSWVAEQKDKVVLVDYWATWCRPCLAKFPKVVELHKKYSEQGLVVCAVSMDELTESDEKETLDKVNGQLGKMGAPFKNLIAQGGGADAFEAFDLGSVPTYRIYGKDGQLIKKFDGEFDFAEIEQLIADQFK